MSERGSPGGFRPPFTAPEEETPERKRPTIRNIDDVWCWMNTWGDLRKHDFTHRSPEDFGYRQAIRDLMYVLAEAGISDVPDEAWSRWTE